MGQGSLIIECCHAECDGIIKGFPCVYRESDDRQLLADLNPILLAIVSGLLNQPGPHRRLMA